MTRREFFDHIHVHVFGDLKACYKEDGLMMKRLDFENDGTGEKGSAMFLIFSLPDKQVSSVKNLDELYEQYLTGTDPEKIIDQIVETGREMARIMEKVPPDGLFSFDEGKERIFIRIRPGEKKRNTTSRQVSVEYEYFRADLCIDLGDETTGSVILPVVRENLKRWGMSRKELFEAVLERQRREGIRFFPIGKDYAEIVGNMETNYYGKDLSGSGLGRYVTFVLTTCDRQYGASLILDDTVLKTVYGMFGGDYIILPSSTHELIVLSDPGRNKDEGLVSLVREINETDVAFSERACDMAFYYDGEEGKVIALAERLKKSSIRLMEKQDAVIRKFFVPAGA